MNYQQAKIRADILKALAHPVRVLIVEKLTGGDRCVCELNALADIDQSNISRHLALLKKAGIVSDRRAGMRVFYHLRTPCILTALHCAVKVMKGEAPRDKFTRQRRRHRRLGPRGIFAESCEAKITIPPRGKPQASLAKQGETNQKRRSTQ